MTSPWVDSRASWATLPVDGVDARLKRTEEEREAEEGEGYHQLITPASFCPRHEPLTAHSVYRVERGPAAARRHDCPHSQLTLRLTSPSAPFS